MTTIDVLDYQPQFQPYFECLNKVWLEEYFQVEPIDEWVLGNPEEAIIPTPTPCPAHLQGPRF